MRVMITGGTGFIGGHTVAALLAEGHQPHLLIRDPAKLDRLCALHGIDPVAVTHTVGDILDRDSVDKALVGCESVIHAAAFTSLDPAEMPRALDVNAPGARIVLDAAVAAGCDPVIHVSSISVLFPPQGDVFDVDGPVEAGGEPYAASKAEAENYARSLQAAGQPVVITYPSGVLGPLDLGVNVLEAVMPSALHAPVAMRAPSGGQLLVDVRDVALALARLAGQPGEGPRRFTIGGPFQSWDDFAAAADKATGRARQVVDMTEEMMLGMFDPEVVRMMLEIVPTDDRPLIEATGLEFRAPVDTLTDFVDWVAHRSAPTA